MTFMLNIFLALVHNIRIYFKWRLSFFETLTYFVRFNLWLFLFVFYLLVYDVSAQNLWFQLMFIVLHIEKGTPFETTDQGKFRYRTVWEQLDYGVQFSASRKFLTIAPIVLYVVLHPFYASSLRQYISELLRVIQCNFCLFLPKKFELKFRFAVKAVDVHVFMS